MNTGNNMIDGDDGSHPQSPYYSGQKNNGGNTLGSMHPDLFEKIMNKLKNIQEKEKQCTKQQSL